VRWFAGGGRVVLSDEQPFAAYDAQLAAVPGLLDLAASDDPDRTALAFNAELILEGLHQSLKLAREDLDSQVTYKEMVKLQLLRPRRGQGDRDIN
jgi:hypothetical protein